MGNILSIDPGNIESAFTIITRDTCEPLHFGKWDNEELITEIREMAIDWNVDDVVIEMIGHYGTGMPAGKTVFDTCVWIGRFIQALQPRPVDLIKRATVKTHLCGVAKAKDGNVMQALVDRFAPDTPNRGKGNKAEPGFFYGFSKDIWQAMALGVYRADNV